MLQQVCSAQIERICREICSLSLECFEVVRPVQVGNCSIDAGLELSLNGFLLGKSMGPLCSSRGCGSFCSTLLSGERVVERFWLSCTKYLVASKNYVVACSIGNMYLELTILVRRTEERDTHVRQEFAFHRHFGAADFRDKSEWHQAGSPCRDARLLGHTDFPYVVLQYLECFYASGGLIRF